MKYTVVWSDTGDACYVDYIENITDPSDPQEMVRQCILQNMGYWSGVIKEDFDGSIEALLDEGYYLYTIIEGHPRIVY